MERGTSRLVGRAPATALRPLRRLSYSLFHACTHQSDYKDFSDRMEIVYFDVCITFSVIYEEFGFVALYMY